MLRGAFTERNCISSVLESSGRSLSPAHTFQHHLLEFSSVQVFLSLQELEKEQDLKVNTYKKNSSLRWGNCLKFHFSQVPAKAAALPFAQRSQHLFFFFISVFYWFYKENQHQSFCQEGWITCVDSRGLKQTCPEIWESNPMQDFSAFTTSTRKKHFP